MKATLKFNLPEEKSEFDIAVNSMGWALAIWDLDNFLRENIKYKEAGKDYEDIREKLHNILDDHILSFDSIE